MAKLNSHSNCFPSNTDHLSKLNNLQSLYLTSRNISDTVLQNLSKLTNLKLLFISCLQITDNGLEHLSRLTNLQSLTLKNIWQISNNKLRILLSLTN